MRIITDTSSLYTPEEGQALGLTVVPACTIIDGQVYRDHLDISSETFLERIAGGAVPTSSQPSIGEVLEVYQTSDEETLVLPIGDGLSGTYQNMEGAKNLLESQQPIHVMDTRTLGGPLWYLVQKALRLRDEGLDLESIKEALKKSIAASASFVIPQDFNFLKRSGRLTPVAAKLGTLLKIVPVLTQTQDMKRITIHTIKRSTKKAVGALVERFRELGVNENFLVTVAHGGVREEAAAVLEQLREHFSGAVFKLFQLPPALICHGGPGCIVVQTILM